MTLSGEAPTNSELAGDTYTLTVRDRKVTGQLQGQAATLELCFSVGEGDAC